MDLFDFWNCCDCCDYTGEDLDEELTAKEIGDEGEKKVKYRSRKRWYEYQREIHNYTFRCKSGRTCQIDHIIIRNNSGIIYGKESDQNWTQVLRYGKEKHKFYNPVKQNEVHIKKLREIVGEDAPLRSLIVFANGDIENVDCEKVCAIDEYRYVLQHSGEYCLDLGMIEDYYTKLVNSNQRISEEEHLKAISQQNAPSPRNSSL